MAISRATHVKQTGTPGSYIGTTALEARRALGAKFIENSAGVPRSGLLNPSAINMVVPTATMSYDILACQPIINRTANEGVYDPVLYGTTNITTGAAPATGLSRWDLIWVKQNDTDKGDANNLPTVGVTQGTAASSPTRPTAPEGALVLAEARIYAGTTGTNGGSNSVTQLWKYAGYKGTTLNIRNKTERNELTTPYFGQLIRRLDCDDFLQSYNGTAWTFQDVSPKRRADGPISTFFGSANNSRQIILMNFTRPYAYYVDVWGQSTIHCAAISSGVEEINIAVSANQTQVTNAQAKARLVWNPSYSNLNQTAGTRCNDVAVGAGGDCVARVWIEVVTGAAQLLPSGGTFSYMDVNYWPQDD